MTPRERLLASVQGGGPDRKPVLRWPCPKGGDSDAFVAQEIAPPADGRAFLVEIYNPFGLAMWRGENLNDLHGADPLAGDERLEHYVGQTRSRIEQAREAGADGVWYVLYGARALHSTPMQYGGRYLERDRELLAEADDLACNVLFVVGDDDVYLDFVSDLPAHVFAWDARASGVGAAEVRAMRPGVQASSDPDSEILLACEAPSLARFLEKDNLATY